MHRFYSWTAVFGLSLLMLAGCNQGPSTLTVLARESFQLPADLQLAFESAHNVKIQIVRASTAESLLKQAVANANPPSDVIYGVDSIVLERARVAHIAESYEPQDQRALAPDLPRDADNAWWPVEVDYITIAYDASFFQKRGLEPPDSLRALLTPQLQHKFVLPNPETSPTGFAFLAMTIAALPETGPYPWPQFWKDLTANILHTVPTWNEAYGTQFSGVLPDNQAGEGLHPLVPAPMASAYLDMRVKARPAPRVRTWAGPAFEVVRYVAIRRGSANRSAAEAFVDLVLSAAYQKSLPINAYTYPARSDSALPADFSARSPRPEHPLRIPPAEIERGRERWLKIWHKMVFGDV